MSNGKKKTNKFDRLIEEANLETYQKKKRIHWNERYQYTILTFATSNKIKMNKISK